MSILRVHRPFSYLGDIGLFRPFHLSHKLCTMKIYTSAVFCKNIGCFSPTSAVLTQTSAVFVRTSAALTQTSAVLTPTSAVLALHRPFSIFDFDRFRPYSLEHKTKEQNLLPNKRLFVNVFSAADMDSAADMKICSRFLYQLLLTWKHHY